MATAIDLPVAPASGTVAHRVRSRFLLTFALGLVGSLALGIAADCAYDAAYAGRIVPGVHAGSVDLSGLGRAAAADALRAAYRSYGDGHLILRAEAADIPIAYPYIRRRVDVDAMIDDAMTIGRSGNPLERAVAEIRTLVRGATVEPRVTFDAAALEDWVDSAVTALGLEPVDATIAMGSSGIETTPARAGRAFDRTALQAVASQAASSPSAPAESVIDAEALILRPKTADAVVIAARAVAERMVGDVTVTDESASWTIEAAVVRGWISFRPADHGTIQPVVDAGAVAKALGAIAKGVERAPVSATFLAGKGGSVVGVTASRDGRTLDAAATAAAIVEALGDRAAGAAPSPVRATVVAVRPELTTEEAQEVAPLMVQLGTWTTYFPISERNYWGANIWLPALYIDGTVLAPGQTFDWFTAVGPITRARGFGSGGVIDGDHTDPTGALGGGMCSSSTTLFNAALRAGLRMGARANHIYYIDRYPLGLDATVWAIGGARQSVTFTNDMRYPILIRGFKIRDGSRGYVRYDIYGVPEGRTVSLTRPLVKNVLKATTRTVYVTTLPAGVRKQTEYPVNGMDVWVTRVVKDRTGHVLHQETYYSHYALWNGRIEVGVAP